MTTAIDPNLMRSTAEDGSAETPQSAIERILTFLNDGIAMGGLHFVDPGALTPIGAISTFTKAANTSTIHSATRFSMPADNRLRYDGTKVARCVVIATLSFTSVASNQQLAFALAVNGVISDASIMRTKITTGTDIQAITVMTHPTMNPGDYVELWVANDTSDGDITVEHGHIHAMAFVP